MNKIQYNKNKLISLFSDGFESQIYLYDNDYTLIKIFRDVLPDGKKQTYEMLDNKRKKIEILRELQSDIELLDLVYSGNDFIGYTMKRYDYNNLSCYSRKKEKINNLKLLRNKIEEFNEKGIFIGDLNEKNILISPDKRNIKICDLDNLKVLELDFDTKNKYMDRFIRRCINKDNIDSYCYNIFLLSYYSRLALGYFDIYDLDLPRKFNTSENQDILTSMKHLDDSYQKRYFIDHLK